MRYSGCTACGSFIPAMLPHPCRSARDTVTTRPVGSTTAATPMRATAPLLERQPTQLARTRPRPIRAGMRRRARSAAWWQGKAWARERSRVTVGGMGRPFTGHRNPCPSPHRPPSSSPPCAGCSPQHCLHATPKRAMGAARRRKDVAARRPMAVPQPRPQGHREGSHPQRSDRPEQRPRGVAPRSGGRHRRTAEARSVLNPARAPSSRSRTAEESRTPTGCGGRDPRLRSSIATCAP